MSIENKIEELTTSINNLASILGGVTRPYIINTSSQEVVPTKKVKEVVSEEVKSEETKPVKVAKKTKEPKESEEVSKTVSEDAENLITLAKLKIAEGHDRAAIKNKITELGAAQISALTPDNLIKFKEFLDSLSLEDL